MDIQMTNQPDEAPAPTKLARVVPLSDFQKYMPLVRSLAARQARKLPPSVLREDLVAAGACGLIDALCKHEGALDVRFFAYASIRIRGAMLDELRKQDWVSRRSREKMPDELATTVVRFDDLQEKDREIATTAASASEIVEEKARNERLHAAVVCLPPREAEIIERHYFGSVPMHEIAASMSVSQARVSQLHARATATLKRILVSAGEEDRAA